MGALPRHRNQQRRPGRSDLAVPRRVTRRRGWIAGKAHLAAGVATGPGRLRGRRHPPGREALVIRQVVTVFTALFALVTVPTLGAQVAGPPPLDLF